jgi:hypothetical protein
VSTTQSSLRTEAHERSSFFWAEVDMEALNPPVSWKMYGVRKDAKAADRWQLDVIDKTDAAMTPSPEYNEFLQGVNPAWSRPGGCVLMPNDMGGTHV